jgi:hypothetical protein
MSTPFLRRAGAPAAALLVALFAGSPHAGAQSLLAARGLGFPLEPLDARALALGGVSMSLPGPNLSLVNPAEDGGLPAPTLSFAFQPESYSGSAGESHASGHAQRYPLIHLAFPVRRFVATVGYGSYLDQHWRTRVVDSAFVGGELREVDDRFSSNGGISRLRLSTGFRAAERLYLGAGADLYTGTARDSSYHTVSGLAATQFVKTWSYGGVGFTGGVRYSPAAPVWISASVSTAARLRARSDADTGGVSRSYDLPLRVDAAASGRVGGSTVVAVAGRWAQWSGASDDLADASGAARDVRSGSAGIEYEGFKLGARAIPLRLGAHYTELPFQWGSKAENAAFPAERGVSGGLGFRLAGGAALLDAAVERGKRGGSGAVLDERYWRMSLSLSLLGR